MIVCSICLVVYDFGKYFLKTSSFSVIEAGSGFFSSLITAHMASLVHKPSFDSVLILCAWEREGVACP